MRVVPCRNPQVVNSLRQFFKREPFICDSLYEHLDATAQKRTYLQHLSSLDLAVKNVEKS